MAWLHFWSICTFFNNEIFFKKFENFFRFFFYPKGPPFGFLKNRKKKFKFFEKKFIIRKCAYGPKMKPRQVLGKYFEVYGQLSPITPEARKKRLLFCPDIRISEYLKILMLNRKKSVKTKSFLESKITNSCGVRTHDLLVTRHENIQNVA